MLDTNLVVTFLEIAKVQSLNVAAQKLMVTQPALSHRIKMLEEQVGKTLFIRKRSGMFLNPLGRQFYELCSEMDRAVDKINAFIMKQTDELGGEIAISAVSGLAAHLFPDFLKTFLNKHPHVDITFNEAVSAVVEDEVLTGRSELGVIVGQCQKPSLRIQRLFSNNAIVMVCSKDYFLAKKKKIGADDLAGAKMILHTDKKSRTYANICKSLGLSPATMLGVLRLPSMDDCKYYALKGLGVAFIAEMYVRDELRDGRLVRLPGLSMRSPVSLISRNEKYESPAISAFKEAFVEHCRKMDVRN